MGGCGSPALQWCSQSSHSQVSHLCGNSMTHKGQSCHKELISQEKQAEPLISLIALSKNIGAVLLSESSFSQLREEGDSTLTTHIK